MILSECAFLLSPKGQNCVVLQHRGDELQHECFAHTLEIKPNITIVLKVQELEYLVGTTCCMSVYCMMVLQTKSPLSFNF